MPPPHTALSLILVLLVLLLAPPRSQGSTTRHQSAKPAIATATAPRLRQGSRLIPGNPPATSHEKTSPGGPLHTSGPGSGARSRPRFTYTPAEEALQLYFNTTVAPKRGRLTVQDLEALAAEYATIVVPNKPPRPVHKHPAVFALEGCPHRSPELSMSLMEKLQGEQPTVFLSTPCLHTDSFGNLIANYLESRMCANFTGLHFVSVNLGWDIIGSVWNDNNDDVSIETFVSPLPGLILNEGGVEAMSLSDVRRRCSCSNLCHMHMGTFIQTRPDLVQEILTPLYAEHRSRMHPVSLNETFLHSVPVGSTQRDSVPSIPDIAIHYRCGDNVHSAGMGLLRFPVIANLVPSDARNVYVMSEDERRKTRNGEASFCTQILFNLHKYLAQQFPDKTVVVLRGAKIFDDMTRLALAPVCVASLSSFSLFAAMTNHHKAFFPAVPPHTKDSIFNNHQPFIRDGFTWLPASNMILSDTIMRMTNEDRAKKVITCLSSLDLQC